jgi:acetylglutamate kinase
MSTDWHERAENLMEALPYIRRYYGKRILIKYGGHAMVDQTLQEQVMKDIVLMWYVGMKPILIHGGGPEVSEAMKRMGKEPTFINGLRVTDKETAEIAEMVLAGKTNKGIASLINRQGGRAVGLSGKDANLLQAVQANPELGFVGKVTSVDPRVIETLVAEDYIPVICSVGAGPDGETLNINADHVAGTLAAALGAEKLIMLTDVKGILQDVKNPDSLISTLNSAQAEEMIRSGIVDRGMIPKVEACIEAVKGGVRRAHILDGRTPHALLMEIFTDTGVGTMVTEEEVR